MSLTRFLLIRLSLLALTMVLVSLIIFGAGHILPGDVGRMVLGPFADMQSVAELNARLGTDRPLVAQYLDWAGRSLRGDLGVSLSMRTPVAPQLAAALAQSAALAAVVMILVVPLGIGAGVLAGLRSGSLLDRVITLGGVSLSIIPDFVSALVLMLVFGLWLAWFPLSGPPDGAGFWSSLYHLILPATPLVLNLVGYVARMTRAGVIEARRADFTRTAVLKGMPRRTIVFGHILPNALIPTVAVLSTQAGYILGGILVIEMLFNIQGLGNMVMAAAKARDLPVLQAGVLAMAAIYGICTAIGDLLQALLDPRQRTAGFA